MRILLRNKATGFYYGPDKSWTPDKFEAQIVSSFWDAARVCQADRLKNMEVVIHCETVDDEVAVPVCVTTAVAHLGAAAPAPSLPGADLI